MKTSIILCTYQGERFLEQQLQSLQDQTLIPDELIIQDDGSTDRTVEIIEEFTKKSTLHIKFYKNKTQLGACRNFLSAMHKSTGDILFFCDQDDVWVPQKIDEMVAAFERNPEKLMVICNAELIDDAGNTIQENYFQFTNMGRKLPLVERNLESYFLKYPAIVNGCFMGFRKELRTQSKEFKKENPNFEFQFLHDQYITYLTLATQPKHSVLALPNKLVLHRLHENQAVGVHEASSKKTSLSKVKIGKEQRFQFRINWLQRIHTFLSKLNTNQAYLQELETAQEFYTFRLQQMNESTMKRLPKTLQKFGLKAYHAYTENALKEVTRDLI